MNRLTLFLVRKVAEKEVDNAIKESHMSAPMKSWLIALANATISGIASGLTAVAVGASIKQSVIIVAASAAVSALKWMAQHPIPTA